MTATKAYSNRKHLDMTEALRQFKERAWALKRERGCRITEAFEILAELEGYLDYAEAHKILSSSEESK